MLIGKVQLQLRHMAMGGKVEGPGKISEDQSLLFQASEIKVTNEELLPARNRPSFGQNDIFSSALSVQRINSKYTEGNNFIN